MSLQDKNAGNAGDQLKHALALELIARLPVCAAAAGQSPTWSYAETHAGAGCYETPHMRSLLTAAGLAVDRYASALRMFSEIWQQKAGPALYPGSALLAQLGDTRWDSIALAEADAFVLDRLASNLTTHRYLAQRPNKRRGAAAEEWRPPRVPQPRAQLLPGSFEDVLDRLLAPSRLFLQIDPYYYDSSAPDGEGGRLGRGHLRQVVEALSERDAVLLIFASRRPRGRDASVSPADSDETYSTLCTDLADLNPPVARCFRAAGTPHAVVVSGWGAGRAAVSDLPAADDWQTCWLVRPPISLSVVEEPVKSQSVR